ncbi:MAG: hypothetical protein ACR2OG_09305 [Gemmatimonadaceae bacterium]
MISLATCRARRGAAAALAVLLAGCASGGGGGGGAGSAPQPGGAATPVGSPESAQPSRINSPWPLKTREHVDLWLHAFALVQEDTTRVPLFARGYRDQMTVLKNRGNVLTQLDVNRDKLRARFAVNRALTNAHFLALYFGSWDELDQAIQIFLDANGDPRNARSQQNQVIIQIFAGTFQTSADRDWLRLFSQSVRDEQQKFYHQYWIQRQRELTPVFVRVDSLWEQSYLPKLRGFLNNTQLAAGSFTLSLPLDGEGRTITDSKQQNIIVTSFPSARENAVEAIYVFAHEAIGNLAGQAVNDNTTPTEKREGASDRYTSAAQVVGGALLLRRALPDLADGYARYYLRSANIADGGGDLLAALERAFPLPEAIRAAMSRQLDVVLGGI